MTAVIKTIQMLSVPPAIRCFATMKPTLGLVTFKANKPRIATVLPTIGSSCDVKTPHLRYTADSLSQYEDEMASSHAFHTMIDEEQLLLVSPCTKS